MRRPLWDPGSYIVQASHKPPATEGSRVLGPWAPRGGGQPPLPHPGALSGRGAGGLARRAPVPAANAGHSHPLPVLRGRIQAALKINYTCYFTASA